MAIDFPNSPGLDEEFTSAGVTWKYDGQKWVSQPGGGGGSGGASVTVSDTPPGTANNGDLWYDSSDDDGRLYVYYEDGDSNQWVDASPQGGGGDGGTSYWERTGTTLSPVNAGDDVEVDGNILTSVSGLTGPGYLQLRSTGNIAQRFDGNIDDSYAHALYSLGTDPSDLNYLQRSDGSMEIGGSLNASRGSSAPNLTLRADGKIFIRDYTTGGVDTTMFVIGSDQTGSNSTNIAMYASGKAEKVGGGTWNGLSDRRAKENITDYTNGLAELKQLQPRLYQYIGNTNTFVGLIAQEAESAMPELVEQSPGTLPDGTEVDDLRSLDQTALTFALINAAKEMSARIEALEAEVQAIKGGN